ncbi:MAG: phosphatidate cytidylyltransferase [Dysgonamonadaceae bacterium]|jgi:phosphatidate cytidylyltransferase|nr:phosphatidate cytidylyltransferase [Dysgonamonadaceae bacterium]
MKNFLLRTLTGIVYVVLIVFGVVFNNYTFSALFSIVTVLCLREFYGLINAQKKIKINLWYNCLGGFLLFISTNLYAAGIFSPVVFCAYLAYVIILLISELYEKQQDPIAHAAYIFLGQFYIALPLSLLNLLVFSPSEAGAAVYYPVFVLALLVFIWINDTGAYLIGTLFGKHRFFERISPKKSWEGFWGGLLFTVASSLVFAYFKPDIPCYHWIGISLTVVVFGTWGDLIESLMKRTLAVKDSGKAIPGHGGFLDRFDSLLLAVYAVLFYVRLLMV